MSSVGKTEKDSKSEVTGDLSVPFENWKAYEKAVESGEIEEPVAPIPKPRPRDLYSFNVDQALDVIDLTFRNYTPSKEAFEFFNVVRVVMGEDPEIENSLMHYFLVDLIFGNVTKEQFPYSDEINSKIRLNKSKIAIIASRFSAKSTILTAFMPIYCAVTGKLPGFGDVMFWVSFGDSQQAGAKVQANTIRDICEDSLFCKEYFEKMRFTDEECEFIRKGTGKTKHRAFMFKVKGAAGGSVRGIRYKTERPQIFTFDDIIKNEADAGSTVIMNKLRSMIYSDASNALGQKGKIIIVNTPFNKNDPVYSALESGVWTPVCIPVCEEIFLGMPKEAYKGSWEAMKSYEDIMEKYEDAYYGDTLREFNQELMLRIADKGSRLIDVENLQYISRKAIMENIENYNIYVTTDYTASNSRKGDYSGTFEWAVSSTGNWFLLDLTLRKMGIEEQYEPLINIARRWQSNYNKLVTVGIELDGQQQVNLFTLKKLMIEKKVNFLFARQLGAPYESKGITRRKAGGDKHTQFMRAHPLLEEGKVFFCEELKNKPVMDAGNKDKIDFAELLNELTYITYEAISSKHDDGLDCISMLPMMDVIRPMYQAPKAVKRTDNGWEFEDISDWRSEPDANSGY